MIFAIDATDEKRAASIIRNATDPGNDAKERERGDWIRLAKCVDITHKKCSICASVRILGTFFFCHPLSTPKNEEEKKLFTLHEQFQLESL